MEFYRNRINAALETEVRQTLARESKNAEQRVEMAAVKAERSVIFRLLRSKQTCSETVGRLVRELDLLEARYEA
jgi:CPA1 family monovalent cation:H+ antiporter